MWMVKKLESLAYFQLLAEKGRDTMDVVRDEYKGVL